MNAPPLTSLKVNEHLWPLPLLSYIFLYESRNKLDIDWESFDCPSEDKGRQCNNYLQHLYLMRQVFLNIKNANTENILYFYKTKQYHYRSTLLIFFNCILGNSNYISSTHFTFIIQHFSKLCKITESYHFFQQ